MAEANKTSTPGWRTYAAHMAERPHTVVGDLRVLPDFHSPQLGNRRDVLVWLPPAYAAGRRRYPVIYFHDGQNLFDRATSFAGDEWQVDETLTDLSAEGLEAIAVGVPHMGEARLAEYNPFTGQWPARGEAYLAFVADTLKPMIDRDFRTQPERERTGIVGSSMGGLISLFAFFRRHDVFGFVGALSPALWVGGGIAHNYAQHAPAPPGRIYLDHGSRENSAERMRDLLVRKGYRLDRDLKYVREEGGEHRESAWARRLPDALRFLLSGVRAGRGLLPGPRPPPAAPAGTFPNMTFDRALFFPRGL